MVKRPPNDSGRRDEKRRAINALRYDLPYMSQSALAGICRWANEHGGLPDVRDSREIRAARDDLAKITTPYGPLLIDVPFKKIGGGELMIEFLHPWAGLFHLARSSGAFADMLLLANEWNEGCSPSSPF